MPRQNKTIGTGLVLALSTIALAAALILTGCKKKPAQPPLTDQNHHHDAHDHHARDFQLPPDEPPTTNANEPAATNANKPPRTDTNSPSPPKITLDEVIRSATTWGPAYKSWQGRQAPDFTLTDITGKKHKLSDYRGKTVMITFWATWCRPCKIEMPHLIALRNTASRDDLAMLAISYITTMPPETTAKVKKFVQENERINYPVFSVDPSAMPAPFNMVNSIPCSFFIDPEGKIKLATQGLLYLGYMKAIMNAQ